VRASVEDIVIIMSKMCIMAVLSILHAYLQIQRNTGKSPVLGEGATEVA
jgi:hypothetical protein